MGLSGDTGVGTDRMSALRREVTGGRTPPPRSRRHLWLAVFLLPLAVGLVGPLGGGAKDERFERTVASLPDGTREVAAHALELGHMEAFFLLVPDRKLEGAWLRHGSRRHWITGGLSFVVLIFAAVLLLPRGNATLSGLLLPALFTATVGIALLCALQWAAELAVRTGAVDYALWSPKFRGLYLVKFIGLAYASALDPSVGFVGSFTGFFLGVAFCQELTKVLPVWNRLGEFEPLDMRGVIAVAFASGVGFGVSEGIAYAGAYYNGVYPLVAYLSRFLGSVFLHAVLAVMAGLSLYYRRHVVGAAEGVWEKFRAAVVVLSGPMFLHALYDTALKRGLPILALLTALVSLGALFWLLERCKPLQSEVNPLPKWMA